MLGIAASRPLLRFRLAGIPVDVQPWFVLVLALGALGPGAGWGSLVWIGVAAASVLWHELGHAAAMRAFGYAPHIELHAMGGRTHWPEDADPSPRKSLVVTAAGPCAGLLLGSAVWAGSRVAGPLPPLVHLAVRDALFVNVAWSLFNLLPMLELDGAHLLEEVSSLQLGRVRRPRWVGWVSLVTGGAVVLWAIARDARYAALLGALGAMQGYARARPGTRRRGASSVGEARRRAGSAIARGDVAAAAAALLPEARVGALPEGDLAELVSWLAQLRRFDDLVALCRDRLGAFARRDDAEPLARLAAEALAGEGAREHALAVNQAAFQQLNLGYHAYDAAGHLAELGHHAEAVAWLERALGAGLDCGDALRTDPALDALRDRDDFRALVAKAKSAIGRQG